MRKACTRCGKIKARSAFYVNSKFVRNQCKVCTGAKNNRPDHPNADKAGHVPEHRIVMSSFLGRPLRPYENVHHKNGLRADNRIENLELWLSSQPKGQRVQDLLSWAREIVNTYDAEVLA